jgi:hypothetical protein
MTTQNAETIEVRANGSAGVQAVTFVAQQFEALSRQVTAWLMEHPSAVPLSFSHAAETRYVVRNPASLAGPERVVLYSGILLVRPL